MSKCNITDRRIYTSKTIARCIRDAKREIRKNGGEPDSGYVLSVTDAVVRLRVMFNNADGLMGVHNIAL